MLILGVGAAVNQSTLIPNQEIICGGGGSERPGRQSRDIGVDESGKDGGGEKWMMEGTATKGDN